MPEWTKSIKELSSKDQTLAGGKGASLGEMMSIGLPVPDGFVVTSMAFTEFRRASSLDARIQTLLSKASYESQTSVSEASSEIRHLITSAPIPAEIRAEIQRRFREMKLARVAVRSSALGEDSLQHTFAGQHDSFLNTREAELLDRIRECWASAFSQRALFYRHSTGLEPDPGSMAVVVQRMVDSRVAGVAFSLDPVSGNSEVLVIEVALGLGEHVVSGRTTPERFEVTKNPLAILERHLRPNQSGWNSNASLSEIKNTSGHTPATPQILADAMILDLARLVLRAESHYGLPVDVEWAEADDHLYLVQCRPVTAAVPQASPIPTPAVLDSILGRGDWSYYVSRRFNWFLEGTQIGASQLGPQVEVLGFGLPLANYLILNGDEYYLKTDLDDINSALRSRFEEDSNFFDKFASSEFQIVETLNAYRRALESKSLGGLSNSDLAQEVDDFSKYYTKSFVPTLTRPDGYLEEELNQRLRRDVGLTDAEAREAFSRIARCPPIGDLAYAEEPLALLRIAVEVRDRHEDVGALSEESFARVRAHAAKFAWLKNPYGEADVSFTIDDFLARMRYLVSTDLDARIRGILEVRSENEKEYRELVATKKISGITLKVCEAQRNFIFLRTYTTEASDSLFYTAKRTLLKEASRRLDLSIEELVMLSASEIASLLRGVHIAARALVDARRMGFAIIWLNGAVSTNFGREAVTIQSEVASRYRRSSDGHDEEGIVRGTPARRGVVTGRAYVALTADTLSDFRPGDVLVAGMTSPDYIEAMEKASAFVTDEGGVTCHAAIIAREFRVPCIVGTINATSVLRTDQTIEVDANHGVVRVLSVRDHAIDGAS